MHRQRMTSYTAVRTRPTDSECPPWCAGHDEMFQPWEIDGADMVRTHASHGRIIAADCGVGVTLEQRVGFLVRDEAPSVSLFFADGEQSLTAAEAKRLAEALRAAAHEVEQARP